jgi:hypothetical protein
MPYRGDPWPMTSEPEPGHGVDREPDADHQDDQGAGRGQKPAPHIHTRQSLDEPAAFHEQEPHRRQHPREPEAEDHHEDHPQGRPVDGHGREEQDKGRGAWQQPPRDAKAQQ